MILLVTIKIAGHQQSTLKICEKNILKKLHQK